MSDGLKNRGKANEEEWARRQQAEAIENMKKEQAKKDEAKKGDPKKGDKSDKGCGCGGKHKK